MTTDFDKRAAFKQKQPGVVYLNAKAYDLMIEALDVVNARVGLAPPQDKLYSFKGTKLRRARENEKGDSIV